MADLKSEESEKEIEFTKEIVIEEEIYALDEIPPENSGVVKVEKEKLLGAIDLRALVTDLGRVGGFIRVAYNAVGAAGYKHTEAQIEIQRLGYDITKLSDKSALTVARFEKASNIVLTDLQCTYEYLLENFEGVALETLSSVSKLAGEMEKAALELYEDFVEQEKKVVKALENTQHAKQIQANKVEEEKKRRIQLEEDMKHEQELIKEHQEKEKEAEARRLSLEIQEDKAISGIGLSTGEKWINAVTAFLGIKPFNTKEAKKKAVSIKQNRLEALEREMAIREAQRKALANMSEFAAKLKQCANDQEMAECAVEALHEAIGALKHLSAMMMQAAMFWKQMKDHCHSLAESETKSVIENFMTKDKKKRLKIWKSTPFKRKAIEFYSGWVALKSVCAVSIEQIKATRQDLYKYITENPTYEECKRHISSIAEKFMAELKHDQNALAEKDLEAQTEMLALKDKLTGLNICITS